MKATDRQDRYFEDRTQQMSLSELFANIFATTEYKITSKNKHQRGFDSYPYLYLYLFLISPPDDTNIAVLIVKNKVQWRKGKWKGLNIVN